MIVYWVFSALLSLWAYIYGEVVYLAVLNRYMPHDPYGFVIGGLRQLAPYFNYIIPFGVVVASYMFYEWLTAPRCPDCGRRMVLRHARRGMHAGEDFWGCSGYPHCKGIVGTY